MKSRVLKWLLWGVAIVFVLGFAGTVLLILFVFSIGTAVATLEVTTTALAKGSGRSIPGCRLAFEQHSIPGFGRTEALTDARGVSRHRVTFSYGGSMFLFWDRSMSLVLTMYVGDPPRFNTADEVEMWVIHLPFDEPWRADRVSPAVRVERHIAFENFDFPDGRFQQAGSRPAPAPLPADALGPVEIRISRDAEGRGVYDIPLTLHLDEAQARACAERRP